MVRRYVRAWRYPLLPLPYKEREVHNSNGCMSMILILGNVSNAVTYMQLECALVEYLPKLLSFTREKNLRVSYRKGANNY